ncbi:MAG TPA: hypothetical protein V6D27_10780 [Vampirovibrionales bacterium]
MLRGCQWEIPPPGCHHKALRGQGKEAIASDYAVFRTGRSPSCGDIPSASNSGPETEESPRSFGTSKYFFQKVTSP